MPNRSRRILCRAGFLTFCLVPTLALAGWIVNEWVTQDAGSPIADADVDARPLAEAELSRLVGLNVTLDRITYPPTGFTLLEGLTISDPETGARIAYVPLLEMGRSEDGLLIRATRPEVESENWNTLWETLHNRVLRERGGPITPIKITASQATLVSRRPDRSPTFSDVQIRLAPGKASIAFRLAGTDADEPARFVATRERSNSTAVTRWELHTGGAEFPCATFSEQAPWLATLGEECVFDGSLWCEETSEGRRGEASGHIRRLNLQRLVSDRFPQVLTGQTHVTLNRAEFAGGRLRSASGAIDAGPGTIGGDLLGEAIGQFDFRYTDELREAVRPLIRYKEFKLGFTIDENGLQVSGACDAEGTILSLDNQPQARVLDQPANVTPVAALVRILSPPGELHVPASQESDALLRVLPLPALKPSTSSANTAPEARVRLQE
jgi:hypothetical protein